MIEICWTTSFTSHWFCRWAKALKNKTKLTPLAPLLPHCKQPVRKSSSHFHAFPCWSDVHRVPNLSTNTFFSCSFRDSYCRHVNLLFVQLSVVCLRKPRRYLLTFLVENCVHLAVSAKDTEGSKSAFVASASTLEKWSSLTGFSEQIKGLWFLICRYFSSQHGTVTVSFNFFFCFTIGLDACEEIKKENF